MIAASCAYAADRPETSTDVGTLGNNDYFIDVDGNIIPKSTGQDIGSGDYPVDKIYTNSSVAGGFNYGTCSSDVNGMSYTVVLTGYPTLQTGLVLMFTAPYANTTTTPQISYNGTQDTIVKLNNEALTSDHIEQYMLVIVVFNGSNWVIMNEDANP